MKEVLLHTPEGVRDSYNSEFTRKERMEHHVKTTIQSYGFHQLMPPTFEYFDIFLVSMEKSTCLFALYMIK